MTMAEKICKELFQNGGPMKASYPNGKRTAAPARKASGSTPCLEAEQARLLRSWGGLEDEAGNFWGYSYNRDGKRVRVCIPARDED